MPSLEYFRYLKVDIIFFYLQGRCDPAPTSCTEIEEKIKLIDMIDNLYKQMAEEKDPYLVSVLSL